MESDWCAPAVIVAITSLGIGLFVRAYRKRIMIWSPWVVSLSVNRDVTYHAKSYGEPGVEWYEASSIVKIRSWSHITVDDFYAEVNVGNETQRCELYFEGLDTYGNRQRIVISSGYRLEPDAPIGLPRLNFMFLSRDGEPVNRKATIVMKVGIRQDRFPIRKRITLSEVIR